MDRKFTSLKEISDYAHSLIRDKSEKELKSLIHLNFWNGLLLHKDLWLRKQ